MGMIYFEEDFLYVSCFMLFKVTIFELSISTKVTGKIFDAYFSYVGLETEVRTSIVTLVTIEFHFVMLAFLMLV